jgi:hypothetical protein
MDAADRQPERVRMRRRLTAGATRRNEAPMMSRLSMSLQGRRRVMFIPAPDRAATWAEGLEISPARSWPASSPAASVASNASRRTLLSGR